MHITEAYVNGDGETRYRDWADLRMNWPKDLPLRGATEKTIDSMVARFDRWLTLLRAEPFNIGDGRVGIVISGGAARLLQNTNTSLLVSLRSRLQDLLRRHGHSEHHVICLADSRFEGWEGRAAAFAALVELSADTRTRLLAFLASLVFDIGGGTTDLALLVEGEESAEELSQLRGKAPSVNKLTHLMKRISNAIKFNYGTKDILDLLGDRQQNERTVDLDQLDVWAQEDLEQKMEEQQIPYWQAHEIRSFVLGGGLGRTIRYFLGGAYEVACDRLRDIRSIMAPLDDKQREEKIRGWQESAFPGQSKLEDALSKMSVSEPIVREGPSGKSAVLQITAGLAQLSRFAQDAKCEAVAVVNSTLARAGAYGFFDAAMATN